MPNRSVLRTNEDEKNNALIIQNFHLLGNREDLSLQLRYIHAHFNMH